MRMRRLAAASYLRRLDRFDERAGALIVAVLSFITYVLPSSA